MKRSDLKKDLIWSILLVFIFACVVPGVATPPTQQIITISESDLNTLVSGTSNAAQIQTASALPTITPTFTPTRIPSKTYTPTPTFIYLLPTATPVPSYTPFGTVGNIIVVNGTIVTDERLTDRPWTCLVTGSTPPRNVEQQPGKDFYVTWTVMNTGTKDWPNTGIDFVYASGYRTEQRHIQDLWRSVAIGKSIDLKILLSAPKKSGMYSAIWALKVGRTAFCHMKIVFMVK